MNLLVLRDCKQGILVWLCVCVKLSGFTETQISEILFLVPRRYEESKCGGHLQLWHRNRAVLTWYQIVGHTGPLIKA